MVLFILLYKVVLTFESGWNPEVWPFKWKLLSSTSKVVLSCGDVHHTGKRLSWPFSCHTINFLLQVLTLVTPQTDRVMHRTTGNKSHSIITSVLPISSVYNRNKLWTIRVCSDLFAANPMIWNPRNKWRQNCGRWIRSSHRLFTKQKAMPDYPLTLAFAESKESDTMIS